MSGLEVLFPGFGISLKSGGKTSGSLFFTRNSSVVLVFSFLRTLPASLNPEHELKRKIVISNLI